MLRHSDSSSFFGDLRIRELNGFRVRKRPYLGDLSSDLGGAGTGVVSIEHGGVCTPPTAISFCKGSRNSHILAVSDEDGYVSFYNTRRALPSYASSREHAAEARVCDWLAHNNAIFDICWTKDGTQILTASGDQNVKLWDYEKKKCIGILSGHDGSVKTICSHTSNPDLIVSGSRDGSFALWDLRCKSTSTKYSGESCISSIAIVKGAHISNPGKRGRRRKTASMSITSVLYLKDEISIATAGAVDSVVKFWDTRNLKSSVNEAYPCFEPSNGKEKAQHGITSLSQDAHGSSIAASCMDNRIYLYDLLHLDKGPMNIFNGSKIESFFVKSVISPDGLHILGGSSQGNAYIWQVKKPEKLPVILKGHEGEVTAVDWCSSEFGKIATSSDDFTVRVWKMKGARINTTTPVAIRNRVTAPNVKCRKLTYDDTSVLSMKMDDTLHDSIEVLSKSTSPVEIKTSEFNTPDSRKKRSLVSYLGEEIHKSPEATSGSPSSVLSPPSSLKRRTIRDYFLAAS